MSLAEDTVTEQAMLYRNQNPDQEFTIRSSPSQARFLIFVAVVFCTYYFYAIPDDAGTQEHWIMFVMAALPAIGFILTPIIASARVPHSQWSAHDVTVSGTTYRLSQFSHGTIALRFTGDKMTLWPRDKETPPLVIKSPPLNNLDPVGIRAWLGRYAHLPVTIDNPFNR